MSATLAVAALALVLTLVRTDKPAPETGVRSIAVLPFRNLGGDPSQDYFSDGLTADLITDLAKISSLGVVARNSVFTYKGMDVDVRRLRDELGVTYVLEGSVRREGNRVRISARLIDTQSGHNLWAERFDGELGGIFALQDEVTEKILSSLTLHLTDSERVILDREYTRSVEAYDEFLRGWQLFWNLSKDSNRQARAHFQKAIALDPAFARAYANLALTYGYDYTNGWTQDTEYAIAQARRYAQKGVELDPRLPQVHWVMSLIHVYSREYQAAIEAAQLTLQQDPNYADGYGVLANALNYAGKPGQALEVMEKAMRLDPHYPHIYLTIRGEIHFNLRDYAAAIEDLEAALTRNPETQEARLWLAAAYAHAGRIDDADWQLEHIRYTGTRLTLDYIEKFVPFNDPLQRKHLLDGLYKAGLEQE